MTSASAATHPDHHRISPVFLGIVAVMAVAGWVVWSGLAGVTGVAVFFFVVAGWVVSLCLHEYAHARTALRGGDSSVAAKGYLTLNPFKYAHAGLSIALPVIILLIGGFGMPGGAVYIERDRVRDRWRHSLISAAGPLTNVLAAVVLTAPFWLGAMDQVPFAFRYALAFLAMLQVTAAILNLLPVPGLDGYGVLEPWLPRSLKRQIEPFAQVGVLVVFGCLLWFPPVSRVLWDGVGALMQALGVTELDVYLGYEYFRFWQGEPAVTPL
jgi:Zn-dependent protease